MSRTYRRALTHPCARCAGPGTARVTRWDEWRGHRVCRRYIVCRDPNCDHRYWEFTLPEEALIEEGLLPRRTHHRSRSGTLALQERAGRLWKSGRYRNMAQIGAELHISRVWASELVARYRRAERAKREAAG